MAPEKMKPTTIEEYIDAALEHTQEKLRQMHKTIRGTGFFSGSGLIGSEIFPTRLRARALGFTYNGARTLSAVAPFVIGRVGQIKGLGWAFYLCAASFLLATLFATQLPETKGAQLQ